MVDEEDITRFPEDDDPESLMGEDDNSWAEFDIAWVVDSEVEGA